MFLLPVRRDVIFTAHSSNLSTCFKSNYNLVDLSNSKQENLEGK